MDSYLTMEVHVGKMHSENFECGLCDNKFKDIEALNMHMATCEIYECNGCYFRVKTLADIKKHFQNKHEDDEDVKITHGKVNRKCGEEIDDTEYFIHELSN